MAIKPRELYQRFDREGFKKYYAERVRMHVFAADPAITVTNALVEEQTLPARGDIWPWLTPVRFDDTVEQWRVWSQGFAIEGFLLGADNMSRELYANRRTGRLQLCEDAEVMGAVLIRGAVSAEDVFLPPGESQAVMEDALRNTLREDGIDVYNLTHVH